MYLYKLRESCIFDFLKKSLNGWNKKIRSQFSLNCMLRNKNQDVSKFSRYSRWGRFRFFPVKQQIEKYFDNFFIHTLSENVRKMMVRRQRVKQLMKNIIIPCAMTFFFHITLLGIPTYVHFRFLWSVKNIKKPLG